MAQRREHPYIWATWLPRLLTGENSCEWAIWFKAHHQNWTKVPSDFNQAEWMLTHTSLLNEKKSQWEARRQHVYVEGQNSFLLRGQSAKLAGEVVYPTRTARVPMGSLHTQFKTDLGALIRRIAADSPAARVPSEHECRFCDITANDCPNRMEDETHPEESTTADFWASRPCCPALQFDHRPLNRHSTHRRRHQARDQQRVLRIVPRAGRQQRRTTAAKLRPHRTTSHHSDGSIPSRMATMTASRRLDAPSFFRRFSMWFLAVYQLTPSSSAMYLVSQPSAR